MLEKNFCPISTKKIMRNNGLNKRGSPLKKRISHVETFSVELNKIKNASKGFLKRNKNDEKISDHKSLYHQ